MSQWLSSIANGRSEKRGLATGYGSMAFPGLLFISQALCLVPEDSGMSLHCKGHKLNVPWGSTNCSLQWYYGSGRGDARRQTLPQKQPGKACSHSSEVVNPS